MEQGVTYRCGFTKVLRVIDREKWRDHYTSKMFPASLSYVRVVNVLYFAPLEFFSGVFSPSYHSFFLKVLNQTLKYHFRENVTIFCKFTRNRETFPAYSTVSQIIVTESSDGMMEDPRGEFLCDFSYWVTVSTVFFSMDATWTSSKFSL